jgi:uncharacterized membrane protein YdbT with pleckstrin-like domain
MPTQLMPGERSIALVRQHWSVLAGHVLGAIVVIVVAIVLNAVLPTHIGSLSITTIKTVIVLVLIIASVLWAGARILRWRFATYHLTDRRIVMEGGILSRTAETIPLDRIQNTVIHRPIGDRLIGAGDIEIESAGRDGVEVLHRIPKAEAFYNELLATMNAPQSGGAVPPRPTGV